MLSFSVLMFQLLLASLLLRVLWLDQPDGQTIFDENYYVNAARIVLHVPVESGQPYAGAPAGLDPNTEHPPLGKLLIAGSMWLFGDNPYGWRIPAVVFGTATIGLIAGCVLAAGGSSAAALTAAFLVAFDNLAFVHSRLGTLDVFVLAFSVLCIFCYLRRWPLAAGAALGLAGLVKIHGLWLALAIIGLEGYLIWRDGEPRQLAARSLAKTGAAALVAFGGGLLILDRFFTTYAWPWQHLQRIFGYGLNLKAGAHPGQFSYPWDWLLNQQQMPYYHLDRFISANGQVLRQIPEMSFTGAMNPYLIFLAPIAIASAAYIAWKTRDRLAALAVCWMIATYLPFYALAAAGRVSYIFYFLPTVPAVALAIGLLLQRLPLAVRCAYLAAYLLGFASLFPFRVLP